MIFSYIHVPGCSCSTDYAAQLSAARHAEVERIGSAVGAAWDHAVRCIPDGSCLAWLDRHEGWPADHRDYHLMDLWRAALEDWQAECTEAGEMDLSLPLSWTRLQDALAAAPHGAQPDGSFITRQTIYQIASGRYVHALHAPGKGGPIAEYSDAIPYQRSASLTMRTRSAARAIREAERARGREAQAEYSVLLDRVAAALRTHPAEYDPGQKGGAFTVEFFTHALVGTGIERVRVSAPGALRRADLVGGEVERALDLAKRHGRFALAMLDPREVRGEDTPADPRADRRARARGRVRRNRTEGREHRAVVRIAALRCQVAA